jgi:hypothetical protein
VTNTLYEKNKIDISIEKLEFLALTVADFAADSLTSSLNLTFLIDDPNNSNKKLVNKTETVKPLGIINKNLILLDLRQFTNTTMDRFYFIRVRASNDGQRFGNQSTTLTVFDSRFYNCDSVSLTCLKSSINKLKSDLTIKIMALGLGVVLRMIV